MRRKKYISLALFLLGLGLILYPQISKAYYDNYFRLEIEEFKKEIKLDSSSEMEVLYEKQLAYNERSVVNLNEIEIADVGVTEDNEEAGENLNVNDEGILGIIYIDKIDLAYAIRDGASDSNLANGVARLQGTSYPVGGMDTNSVIAGHRGWAEKTFFSRLKELEQGDLIEIENQRENLFYEVFRTEVIEPTNIEALAPVPGQDMITLLTCTGPTNQERLLVFAKRTEVILEDGLKEGEQASSEVVESDLRNKDDFSNEKALSSILLFLKRYGFILLTLLLGLIVGYFVFLV